MGFCPGVRVHKGMTIVLSLFRSHWLAVLCSGSREPRTEPIMVIGGKLRRRGNIQKKFQLSTLKVLSKDPFLDRDVL